MNKFEQNKIEKRTAFTGPTNDANTNMSKVSKLKRSILSAGKKITSTDGLSIRSVIGLSLFKKQWAIFTTLLLCLSMSVGCSTTSKSNFNSVEKINKHIAFKHQDRSNL